jgi:hypothetical protein
VSRAPDAFAERRVALVARAAADRAAVARQLAPLGAVDGMLGRLEAARAQLPTLAAAAGFGLSALLLAFPSARFPVLRAGLALINLSGSVRRLFSRR